MYLVQSEVMSNGSSRLSWLNCWVSLGSNNNLDPWIEQNWELSGGEGVPFSELCLRGGPQRHISNTPDFILPFYKKTSIFQKFRLLPNSTCDMGCAGLLLPYSMRMHENVKAFVMWKWARFHLNWVVKTTHCHYQVPPAKVKIITFQSCHFIFTVSHQAAV